MAELWAIYTSGPLYAWLELVTAARTDPELRAHVAAVDARFEDEATETIALLFRLPDERARAAARLVTSVLDGLATHQILASDDAAARRVLDLFAALLRR